MNESNQPELVPKEPELPVYLGEPVNYTQNQLEAKALKFIKENKPQEYRKLKASGELQEYCRLSAKAAREYAESLMKSGEPDTIAWNRAIRLEILESETD